MTAARASVTTLYNPHLLSRAELDACFLARHELLAELVDDLRHGGAQHHLLVGERGAGKTMLLLRLAAAIDGDGKLAKHCLALRFSEEQYNVAHLADLWCNALGALADAYAERGLADAATRVTAELAALADLDPDARAAAALAALVAHGKPAHRKLVLLVDNFDLVLARIRDARWALREALSADNGLVLVGASSTLVDDVTAYESPFYDFFHVHHLDALSEADARRVAGVGAADAGRFQALYVITGGAPRTLALAREVLGGAHPADPARDLDRLLDRVTPTYKARLDALPAQSQIVVDAVALHWHPISAAECARRAHLDINTASAQLHRLVKSGVLAKVGQPDGPKLGFQLADRLFGLWYLMRAGRRHREQVAAVFALARVAYSGRDRDRRAALRAWSAAHEAAPPGEPLHELVAALAAHDRLPRLAPEVRAVANEVIAALGP